MRRLLVDREGVDQALRVFDLEGDGAGEGSLEVRVIDVEALGDEVGMVLVLGKDDGLPQAVAAGHLEAARHQVGEHLVDGVGVEQPLVDRRGLDALGDGAVLVPLDGVPRLLILLR